MSNYFSFFPKQLYQTANSSFEIAKTITDVSRKSIIMEGIPSEDPKLLYSYKVREGERAEDVSYFYYDSTDYVWLVWLSNNIIDPYSQWVKTFEELNTFVTVKYKPMAAAEGEFDVVAWTKNTQIDTNIKYMENVVTGQQTSKSSYDLMVARDSSVIEGDWQAKRFFDYEFDVNESYREIRLINEGYKTIAEENLRRLMNGG